MKIELTQGKVALIDDQDAAVVDGHRWFAARHGRTWYAKAVSRGTTVYDYLASADFLLDQERDHFPCRTCGSRMPTIIEGRFCCDCTGENAEGYRATREARLAREAAA